ncbi:MAG: endonuclease [Gammaproteobacteria bacterium]
MRIEQRPIGARRILEVHTRLVSSFGPQKNWWPAECPFEILLGALLVQHTRWSAVMEVLNRLRSETGFDPERLLAVRGPVLEAWLRPAGCHHQKARRIRAIAGWYRDQGWQQLSDLPSAALREKLLAQEGIGPETADAILLYAFRRRVWVTDRSALRLYSRLGFCQDQASDFRERVLPHIPDEIEWRKEHHALVVLHGQRFCGVAPRCTGCPLTRRCEWHQRAELS